MHIIMDNREKSAVQQLQQLQQQLQQLEQTQQNVSLTDENPDDQRSEEQKKRDCDNIRDLILLSFEQRRADILRQMRSSTLLYPY